MNKSDRSLGKEALTHIKVNIKMIVLIPNEAPKDAPSIANNGKLKLKKDSEKSEPIKLVLK